MFPSAVAFTFLALFSGLGSSLSKNNEVWRSTGMVKTACTQEEEYQTTGQYPKPIKDQEQQGLCGWFSKGQPRGDACADIRMHFTSCKDQNISRHTSVRVINGTDARKGAFPSVADLGPCTGSIVNNNWLLTAAHCFRGSGASATNRWVGVYDTLNRTGPNVIRLKKEKNISHPKDEKIKHDIGVAKVNHFDYNDDVKPIEMPPSKDFRYMGPAYFVGYGYNDTERGRPRFLQEVTLPVIDTDICRKLFNEDEETFPDDNFVCAGYFNNGKRACNGDSGGPLFYCHNYRLIQYAVISAGSFQCGETPLIFMRLSQYSDWILDTIKNN